MVWQTGGKLWWTTLNKLVFTGNNVLVLELPRPTLITRKSPGRYIIILIMRGFVVICVWLHVVREHKRWLLNLQWHLYSGTPIFKGHKMWSRKNVHVILGTAISIERTPLITAKGHFFWVLKPGFNLHSGDTLALKKVTDHKKHW